MTIENWNVVVTPKADKQLQKLPEAIQDIVLEALEALAAEGIFPKHWDVKKTNDH
jgi:mRNA-degrading endonuclease RelE of RelBE toxin-antitoxin system